MKYLIRCVDTPYTFFHLTCTNSKKLITVVGLTYFRYQKVFTTVCTVLIMIGKLGFQNVILNNNEYIFLAQKYIETNFTTKFCAKIDSTEKMYSDFHASDE